MADAKMFNKYLQVLSNELKSHNNLGTAFKMHDIQIGVKLQFAEYTLVNSTIDSQSTQ